MKTSIALFALFAFVLSGCAGHREIITKRLNNENSSFAGQHCDELLKCKGVPDHKAQLSTGEEVWTYRSTRTGEQKGMMMTVGTGNVDTLRRPIVSWTETVNFIIDSDGYVKEVSIEVQ